MSIELDVGTCSPFNLKDGLMISCKNAPLRELTALEHSILRIMCQGKSNSAIANEANRSIKVIENTISRVARVFGITSTCDNNIRVLLALTYQANYGDIDYQRLLVSQG